MDYYYWNWVFDNPEYPHIEEIPESLTTLLPGLHQAERIGSQWPKNVTVQIANQWGNTEIDSIPNHYDILVVSSVVKEFFEKDSINAEFLPITVLDLDGIPFKKNYFVANFLEVVDAIDRDNSRWIPDENGAISFFTTFEIAESSIPKGKRLFRLKDYPTAIWLEEDYIDEFLNLEPKPKGSYFYFSEDYTFGEYYHKYNYFDFINKPKTTPAPQSVLIESDENDVITPAIKKEHQKYYGRFRSNTSFLSDYDFYEPFLSFLSGDSDQLELVDSTNLRKRANMLTQAMMFLGELESTSPVKRRFLKVITHPLFWYFHDEKKGDCGFFENYFYKYRVLDEGTTDTFGVLSNTVVGYGVPREMCLYIAISNPKLMIVNNKPSSIGRYILNSIDEVYTIEYLRSSMKKMHLKTDQFDLLTQFSIEEWDNGIAVVPENNGKKREYSDMPLVGKVSDSVSRQITSVEQNTLKIISEVLSGYYCYPQEFEFLDREIINELKKKFPFQNTNAKIGQIVLSLHNFLAITFIDEEAKEIGTIDFKQWTTDRVSFIERFAKRIEWHGHWSYKSLMQFGKTWIDFKKAVHKSTVDTIAKELSIDGNSEEVLSALIYLYRIAFLLELFVKESENIPCNETLNVNVDPEGICVVGKDLHEYLLYTAKESLIDSLNKNGLCNV